MKLIILFFFISITSAFSQTDFVKWERADFRYEQPVEQTRRDYSFESADAGEFITKSLTNAYWFFISDVDGDNCPFRPSCSVFLLESVRETNVFQATFMFFDRFTRDVNLFKGKNHYPRLKNGYYFDPAVNYTLVSEKINYLPPGFVVDD